MLPDAQLNQKIIFPRLTIPYVFVIGFMATIVPHLSWGLNWKQVEVMESFCETNSWLNVLYVNNFFKQIEGVSCFFKCKKIIRLMYEVKIVTTPDFIVKKIGT